MVLAELDIRHTRRHMPTRRVALGMPYISTNAFVHGAVLLGAVVAQHIEALDAEQADLLPALLRDARDGLSVPRIALRYRLQHDTHGLDRSRHRLLAEHGRFVIELDLHGRPAPQVIGAVMAAAALVATSRRATLRAIESAIARPGVMPEPVEVRYLREGVPGGRPPLPGEWWAGATGATGPATAGDDETVWRGVPAERRWAMEVLGLRPGGAPERGDVQRRFRRLVRLAHPDHGAMSYGAAERIAELAEAREVLLGTLLASSAEGGRR